MDLLFSVVELLEALHHSPPVGQETHRDVVNVGPRALLGQVHWRGCLPVVLPPSEVTIDLTRLLQGCRHRSQHVGKEEVAESYKSEGGDHYLPQRDGNLFAGSAVEAVEREEADDQEQDDANQREGGILVGEPELHFDLGYLPGHAEHDYEEQQEGTSIQLMVDQAVIVVNFEYEGVVD